jgi:hypothetical protein
MPKTGKNGEFAPLPSTLERSPREARDTSQETLESAGPNHGGRTRPRSQYEQAYLCPPERAVPSRVTRALVNASFAS